MIGVLLVSQGVPQNLSQNITVSTIEGKLQDISFGSNCRIYKSIKHLGTNGGGFLGGNSATPLKILNIIH